MLRCYTSKTRPVSPTFDPEFGIKRALLPITNSMSDRPTAPPTAAEISAIADFEAMIKMAGENHARLVRLLAVTGRTLSGCTRAVKPETETTVTIGTNLAGEPVILGVKNV